MWHRLQVGLEGGGTGCRGCCVAAPPAPLLVGCCFSCLHASVSLPPLTHPLTALPPCSGRSPRQPASRQSPSQCQRAASWPRWRSARSARCAWRPPHSAAAPASAPLRVGSTWACRCARGRPGQMLMSSPHAGHRWAGRIPGAAQLLQLFVQSGWRCRAAAASLGGCGV